MSGSIEERIVANLGLDDNTGDTSGTETTTEGADTGQGPAGREAPSAPTGQANTQQGQHGETARQGPADNRGAQRGQQGQGRPERVPANAKGDLIDPGTGQVIARAGNERRYFEQARDARVAVQTLQQQLATLQGQLEGIQQANNAASQLGLTPQEQANALGFMAHWKRDPVAAAKTMIAELQAMGHSIDGVSGVSPEALKRMIDESIKPFRDDRDTARREQEARTAVETEINRLHTTPGMEWTRNQDASLAELIKHDPSLSLREAALMLKLWASEQGFDLNSDIMHQYQARLNGADAPVAAQSNTRPNVARMPGPAPTSTTVPRETEVASVHRSTRDIVRETLREHGINV